MNTKQLRQKILDLAIRGKLIPQDPNDEPASVLLERIRAEKERLIKEGKIKRDKRDSSIIRAADKSHYGKLPEGWDVVQIQDVCIVNPRNVARDSDIASFVPMTMIADGFSNCFTFQERTWSEIKSGFTHFQDGDVGLAKITPCLENKKSVVFHDLINGIGAGTTELHIFRPICGSIISEYLLWFFKNESFINACISAFSGAVGQQRVGKDYVSSALLPLPPLAEQRRIVSAIESAFAVIDKIEQDKTDLQAAIAATKQKILSLAIRGKLIPQDPNDEPASVLLERIRSEREALVKTGKIKRGKGDSAIIRSDDSSYYEKLPDGWAFARLEDVVDILDYLRQPINTIERNKRIKGKLQTELYPYYGATGQVGCIDEYIFDGDYILLGEDGAPFLDKNAEKAYIISGKTWVNNHAHILKAKINIAYLCYVLNALDYEGYVNGTTRLKLTQADMIRIVIPVPPHNEQIRIVTTVKSVFQQMEVITKNLN